MVHLDDLLLHAAVLRAALANLKEVFPRHPLSWPVATSENMPLVLERVHVGSVAGMSTDPAKVAAVSDQFPVMSESYGTS